MPEQTPEYLQMRLKFLEQRPTNRIRASCVLRLPLEVPEIGVRSLESGVWSLEFEPDQEASMSVAALSTAGLNNYIAASSNVSASQQAYNALTDSLAAGNMTAAQSAFNAYQALNQASTSATSSSSSTTSSTAAASQFSTDLTALGTAIGSGSLSSAQSAFATLQSALKSSPSQSVTNAEAAVAQTVSWVDDLLNLSTNSTQDTANEDPTTSILDSAYGQTPNSTTDAATNILQSAYGTGTSTTGSGTTSSSTSGSSSGGNFGNSSSVNAYA